jgi:two-component system LytT family response regulator
VTSDEEARTGISALVVDDEEIARRRLRAMLEALPGAPLRVVGEAANGGEALDRIASLQPDLVFLDLRMPDLDGFEVLRLVPEGQLPQVIFVTGHDDFALQAFEVNAVDYLLKPVKASRLQEAVRRVELRLGSPRLPAAEGEAGAGAAGEPATGSGAALEHVFRLLAEKESRWFRRIPLQYARTTKIVPVEEVLCVRVAEGLVRVRTAAGEMRSALTFRQLEEGLDPERFLRVHRSGIVNLDRIREFQAFPNGTAMVSLEGGLQVEVSRSHVGAVRRVLGL